MKYAAMNINFDSLSQMYGFPKNYQDPSYRSVSRRFFDLSDKFNFKYTIFVIGQDLLVKDNREAVREWAQRGHEIGNHTWSHPLNLGALKDQRIREEIERAHEIITDAVGCEPKGFVAPAWSGSQKVFGVLKDLKYTYDSSLFPSWLMLFLIGKLMSHHLGGADFSKIVQRKDVPGAFWAPRQAHLKDGIVVMPLPTDGYRTACWHTMAFILGQKRHQALLTCCLKEISAFYYLMHPGDLLDEKDLDPRLKIRMERVHPSLDVKRHLLEDCMQTVRQSGRMFVTMKELAEHVRLEVAPDV